MPNDRDRARLRFTWAFAAVTLLAWAAFATTRLLDGEDGSGARVEAPGVVLVTAGGVAFPAPTAVPPAQATSGAALTSEPTPVATPVATPDPTYVVAAATPAPVAPSPAPTAAPIGGADPADAVASFYGHVTGGNFDAAYALWNQRMKSAYPRASNLDGRFDDTAAITFSQLSVAEMSGESATVQANFTETYESGASRQFIGYWRLRLVAGQWLLEEPHY